MALALSCHLAFPFILSLDYADPLMSVVDVLKSCISQLFTKGVRASSHFASSFFSWYLVADKFESSLVKHTPSTAVLAQADLLAGFLNSTAEEAECRYMKIWLSIPPILHFELGYCPSSPIVFKYFSTLLWTYQNVGAWYVQFCTLCWHWWMHWITKDKSILYSPPWEP